MAIDKIQKTSLLIPPAGLDTHIQYNNNGQLAGSSSFVINSSGHVGIGTNDPKDRLHVKIGSDLNWQFGYPSSSTTSLAAINDAENAYVLARIDANPLQINSQSGGGVAIGNTTPTNQNLLITENGDGNYPILEVWNTNTTANAKPMIRIGAGGDAVLELYRIGNAATTYINAAQVGNGNLAFQTEGNTKMVIANDGNVGIGVSDPSAGLEVESDTGIIVSRNGFSQYLQFQPANSGIPTILGLGGSGIHIGPTSATGIRMDGSGNVGVNTTNPETILHIGGTSQFIKMDSGSTTHLYLGGENDFFALSHNRNPSTGVIDDAARSVGVLQYEDSVGWTFSANTAGSFTGRMTIGNDGKIGIGTDPSVGAAALQVKGEFHLHHNADQEGGAVRIASNSNASFMSSNSWYDENLLRVFYNQNGGSGDIIFDQSSGANAGDIYFRTGPSGVAGETTSIVSGISYIITSAGGNFNTFGAADNNVGTEFVATSSGTASGGGVKQINYTTERMRIKENGTVIISKELSCNPIGTNNLVLGPASFGNATSAAANNVVIGDAAALGATDIDNSIIIGKGSGGVTGQNTEISTGSHNVFIGYGAGPSAAASIHQVVIGGDYAVGKGTQTSFLAPNSGAYQGNNSASWSTTSDERLKKNIVDNNVGIDLISQIRVRNFEYRIEDEIDDEFKQQRIQREGVQIGVIAQELQEIFPDAVTEQSTGLLSVDNDELFWYMINAIKDLNNRIIELESA